MTKQFLALTFLSVASLPIAVSAQDKSEIKLPEACVQATQMHGDMAKMSDMSAAMQGMENHMTEAGNAHMQAMAAMHGPMMQGAMAQDPDVAFNCSMIVHHQGAVAMARIQLQYGKDEVSRKLAQTVIDTQSREIADMTKWVEENAKK